MIVFARVTTAFAFATTAPANVAGMANIRVVLNKTNLKANPPTVYCQGVKINRAAQDIVDATYLIQRHGKRNFRQEWPDKAAKVN